MSEKAKDQRYQEMCAQLRKIKALIDDVGVPGAVTFAEEPHKQRSDLPARVEWALLALVTPVRRRKS